MTGFTTTERLLQIIVLFLTHDSCRIKALAEKLGTKQRNIYRYLDVLDEQGFKTDKLTAGNYFMYEVPKGFAEAVNVVHFTETEAEVLLDVVCGLNDSNPIKATMLPKIKGLKRASRIISASYCSDMSENLGQLQKAIENKKTVILMHYTSGHSHTVSDRRVEPYDFTPNYTSILAYDTAKGENLTFKLSRIGKVKPTKETWKNEEKHREYKSDCFGMSGDMDLHIIMELGVMAKSLLLEEFPMAEKDLKNVRGKWILDTRIRALEGAGRFVLGVAKDIHIIEGEELRQYVQDYARENVVHGL